MEDDKDIQFFQKLDSLSAEAQLYFNSKIIGRHFRDLKTKYQFKNDELYDLFDEVILADFNFSLIDSKLPSPAAAADFLGELFLPVASFINQDITKEIINRGGRVENYQAVVKEFNELMDDENFAAIEELIKFHDETFDPEEEENAALDIFSNRLKGLLTETDNNIIINLNGALAYLLINKPDFSAKVNKTLLNNQEILTSGNMIINGKSSAGTIANWLKDFIAENGSEMFNVVVLSKYLADSNNIKNLSIEEKKSIRHLLKLYRNLIFYPESLSGLDPEEWEIVPVEKEVKETPIKTIKPRIKATKVDTPIANNLPTPTLPEVKLEPVKKEIPPIVNNLPIQPPNPEPIVDPLADLKKMLDNYPPGSLERRALEQEIKKRQVKL